MFVGHFLTWYDAEAYCKSTKGHLVALETPEEQEYLVDYIQRTNSTFHTDIKKLDLI